MLSSNNTCSLINDCFLKFVFSTFAFMVFIKLLVLWRDETISYNLLIPILKGIYLTLFEEYFYSVGYMKHKRITGQLCLTLCNPKDCSLWGSFCPWDSLGRNTGVDWHALLQGIFPTQASNMGFLHCRKILYHLSHQGSQ